VTSQELDALVFLAGYGLLLVAAIKIFGLRRVLAVLFGVVFLAVVVAFKTLGAVTGGRRY
jgi:type IV secretory pathway TrbD component